MENTEGYVYKNVFFCILLLFARGDMLQPIDRCKLHLFEFVPTDIR